MTRVLQIRRGSTAANDNFTGLTGEISYDTEEKRLRIHDGQTLGGIAMAKLDEIGTGGDVTEFDINSVSTEFWESVIATYTGQQFTIYESNPLPIANVSYVENIFDTQNTPLFVRAELICQTPQAGYSIDNVVSSFGIGNRANPTPYTFIDTNGLHTRLFIASETFWVNHKDTGVTTNITNVNWKIKFTVWY